jgi:CheY-like chemotaxis protein
MSSGAARILHAVAPAMAAAAPSAVPQLRVATAPARHVAVCDDDVRFIRFVERLLVEADARICPVTELDPADAVRVVADACCDAVMIDLHIYNDDEAGLTLVRLFREDPRTSGLPLLMVTGASQRDLKRHDAFLQSYGCGLLPKPFEANELLTTLGLPLPVVP